MTDLNILVGGEAGQGMQSIGIIYRQKRPVYEEQIPALKQTPLVKQTIEPRQFEALPDEFV